MAERDAVEWLRMMAQYSPLADCKPHFVRIADELEALRAEKAALPIQQQHAAWALLERRAARQGVVIRRTAARLT